MIPWWRAGVFAASAIFFIYFFQASVACGQVWGPRPDSVFQPILSISCLVPEPGRREASPPHGVHNVFTCTVSAERSEHPLLSARCSPVSRVLLRSAHIFL